MNYLYFILLVLALVAIGLGVYLYKYAMESPYRIDVADAKRRIQDGEFDVILDVRTDVERATLGYYPNSIHIQSADLEEQMRRRFPSKNIRILAYCNSGQRARIATEKLHALGYKNSVYIATTYLSLL
jgi:rhodanese-related sulfurtransferase